MAINDAHQPPRRATERRGWTGLLVLFAIAFAARAGWGLWRAQGDEPGHTLEFPDEVQYWNMAVSLHDGHGLRDELGFRATRMPLYPAFLSMFAGRWEGVNSARATQWVIGAIAAPLVALLAGSYFSRGVALLAGLWSAVDPFLIFFSSLLLTETLSITLLCGLWCVIARLDTAQRTGRGVNLSGWIAVAALSIACVYSRESTIGLVVIAVVFLAWRTRSRWLGIAGGVGTLVALGLSLVPWGMRNLRVTGEWCWLTTRSGISLYDGVGPGATGASDLGDVKQSPAVQGLSEHEWNRYFLAESGRAIRENPARVIGLAGIKLKRMWNPLPNVTTHQSVVERWVSGVWTSATLGLAVIGAAFLAWDAVRRRRADSRSSWRSVATRGGDRDAASGQPPSAPEPAGMATATSLDGITFTANGLDRPNLSALFFLPLPALYFSALHALFVGSVRYRLGAMPMLEVLAAFAVVMTFHSLARTGRHVGTPRAT